MAVGRIPKDKKKAKPRITKLENGGSIKWSKPTGQRIRSMGLTQLGEKVDAPKHPDDAVIEVVENKNFGSHFVARFICPEVTSLCLHGDTKIDVACDETKHPEGISIKDLVGTSGIVFSFDPANGKPVAKHYHSVRLTREKSKCLKVTYSLFKGPPTNRAEEFKEIICTPDHLFLTKFSFASFAWVKAEDLTPQHKLVADQRIRDRIRDTPRHRLIAAERLKKQLTSTDIIHHKDHNHFNNEPSNLELTINEAHLSYHQRERYGYDAELSVSSLVADYENGENVHSLALKYNCDDSTIRSRLEGKVEFRTQQEQLLIKYNTLESTQRANECRAYYESGYDTNELGDYYKVDSTTVRQWILKAGGKLRTRNESYWGRRNGHVKLEELPSLNHKVISVEEAETYDVYCMAVEDTNCFFANGVVVHNCPVTAQPDFATLVIDYVPDLRLIESKSLKLFLTSFRNHQGFHEATTIGIARRLCKAASPRWLRIAGFWNARGGINIDVHWQTGEPPKGVWIPEMPNYRGK